MNALKDKIRAILDKPQLNYWALLSITLALVAFGLAMVLSSSMVMSYAEGAGVFKEFAKQALMVLGGFVAMIAVMWISPRRIQRFAPLLLVVAVVLLLLVLGMGVGGEEVGSNSWLRFGGIGIQPSEVAKLALAVWGATIVSRATRENRNIRSLGPFIGVSAAILGLVLMQKDLGMMLTVGIVAAAIVFFAGVSSRIFLGVIAAVGVMGLIAISWASYRSARITTWMDTLRLRFPDSSAQGASYQSYQGILSLADGQLTGVGPGQSRAKWFYLPEAKNDFIFAIIGEELGLIGALFVVVLFAMLGWFGLRTAMSQADPFLRLLAATLTVGIVAQAFYNMGYVVGVFPVTGVQLPLISAGGTSAIITLVSLGLLCSCARHEPAAISSMQHEGRPAFDRIFHIPEPQPYVVGGQRREERRSTTQHYGEPITRREDAPGRLGRAGQDVRRERDRLEVSRQRVGGTSTRGYDGARRQPLPPSTSRRHPGNPPTNRPRRR